MVVRPQEQKYGPQRLPKKIRAAAVAKFESHFATAAPRSFFGNGCPTWPMPGRPVYRCRNVD